MLPRRCPQGLACHICRALGTQPRLHQRMVARRELSWAESRQKTNLVSASLPCRQPERGAVRQLSYHLLLDDVLLHRR